MALISGILGSTPLATSAAKGYKYAQEHPDDPSGGYGQNGIVGTIIKMYLGGAIGGALGGAAGGGASGMTGAMNGMSGVTSQLGGSGGALGGIFGGEGGGLGGLGGSGSAAGSTGGFGGSLPLSIFNGAGGGFGEGAGTGGGWMGQAGDFLQNRISNSDGGSSQRRQQPQQNESPQLNQNALKELMAQVTGMSPQQNTGTGLMDIPGIPDFFKQRMSGWR